MDTKINPPAPASTPPQKKPQEQHSPDDVIYNVMPNGSRGSSFAPTPPMPGGPRSKTWMYVLIAVVVLGGLGAAAYYMLGSNSDKNSQQSNSLPKTWLSAYFNTETCEQPATCGPTADPDEDGLNNEDEFRDGTNPLNPDTDEDGLADGDEVNIFKTEPDMKYTDKRQIVADNNWTDGVQFKNGFDPLTPGIALTESRKQQIKSAIEQNDWNEPTISTFKNSWLDPEYVPVVEEVE